VDEMQERVFSARANSSRNEGPDLINSILFQAQALGGGKFMSKKGKIFAWLGGLIGIFICWVGIIYLGTVVISYRVPVSLPFGTKPSSNLKSFASNGYLKVTGTWVIEGEKSADPLQTTIITCIRPSQTCTSSTATVSTSFGSPYQLLVDHDTYEIKAWTPDQIVFADDSPTCVSYRYTIDLVTGRTAGVRQLRKPVSNECKVLGERLDITLADGFKLTQDMKKAAAPWFFELAILPFTMWH
jgi:hypothetical protein